MFKRYNIYIVLGFLICCVGYVGVFNVLVHFGLEVNKAPYQVLFDHQVKKAQQSKASIALVGDSSLGNAIDATLFSELSGQTTENYALTGNFGFKGSLSMLKEANNKNLKTVIVVQTIDMLTRDIAKNHVPPRRILSFGDFEGVDVSIFNFIAFKAFIKAVKKKKFGGDHDSNQDISLQNDYIKQGPPSPPETQYRPISADAIHSDKVSELIKIVEYCKAQNLNCVYIHGPIVQDLCESSVAYINAIGKVIQDTAIRLAISEPVCIPRNKLGDSADHVRPAYKQDYTRIFYKHVKPYL